MPLGCKRPYPTALPDARRRSRESRGARLLARLPAKHVPTPQPKTSAEEKQNAGCCGFFPPGRRGVGWELALVPENARERRGPVRDSAGLCGMLPGGHRDTEGFSKGSSTSLGLNASLFRSRSADVAPALQVRGCLLLTGAQWRPQQLLATSQQVWGPLPAARLCFRCSLRCYYSSTQSCCSSRKEITAGSTQHNRPSHPALCRRIAEEKSKALL